MGKKSPAVVEAEAALEAARAKREALQEEVRQADVAYALAFQHLQSARVVADKDLPRCEMIIAKRFGSNPADKTPAVILRRTPTGLLIVRPVGGTSGTESKFEWSKFRGEYAQKVPRSRGSYAYQTVTLADVPPEFMPQEATA